MSSVRPIHLDDDTVIFVEVEALSAEAEEECSRVIATTDPPRVPLPPGAEEASAVDRVVDTVEQLKDSLSGVVGMVHSVLSDHQPDEYGVELTVGFKGTAQPIPVFVKGEANATLKIHAKWKKPSENGENKE